MVEPADKPFIVTVDLDSTTCDTGHRHHLIDRVNGTDWHAYSQACVDDVPVAATVEMINIFSLTHEIHFVTGRTESARNQTEAWFVKHGIQHDGLWMDDTPGGDHFGVYGGHAQYKVARIRHVEEATGKQVVLHVDDWAGVKHALEQEGIPCLCVRTPQEIEEMISADEASLA